MEVHNYNITTTGGPDEVSVSLNEYINIHMDKLMRWVVETPVN